MLGVCAGIAVVGWVELGHHYTAVHNISSGIIGLGVNIVVCVVAQLIWSAMAGRNSDPAVPETAESGAAA
jgi:hypothetical protein